MSVKGFWLFLSNKHKGSLGEINRQPIGVFVYFSLCIKLILILLSNKLYFVFEARILANCSSDWLEGLERLLLV